MAVMDEFREEREKLKNASLEKKWKYFKDYYLIWVIVAVVILAIAIPILWSVIFHKEEVLHVCMINFVADDSAQDDIVDSFMLKSGIDSKRNSIVIDTTIFISSGSRNGPAVSADSADNGQMPENNEDVSGILAQESEDGMNTQVSENEGDYSIMDTVKYGYEDEQKLAVLTVTGTCDLIITGDDLFRQFMAQGYFSPLSEMYSETQLQVLEDADRLLYQDGVAVGIYMDDSPVLKDGFFYNGEGNPRIAAGYLANSSHKELAVEFVDFLDGVK